MTEKRDPIFDFLKSLGEIIDSTRGEYFADHGDATAVIDDIDEMYTVLKAKLKENAEIPGRYSPHNPAYWPKG